METDAYLDEVVLFDLPTAAFAERLVEHVGSERFGWCQVTYAGAFVGVLLTSDELDLAVLLRRVQAWAEQAGLTAIRYQVDGRIYLLDAKPAVQQVA